MKFQAPIAALTFIFFSTLHSIFAFANVSKELVKPDLSDGCGLGWQVTQKRSFLATTTRTSTNLVVHPSWGMTSGTLGCDQHSFAAREQEAALFVLNNYELLRVEVASGRGEYLENLALTMNCAPTVQEALFKDLKTHLDSLMNRSENALEFFRNLQSRIHSQSEFAKSCPRV